MNTSFALSSSYTSSSVLSSGANSVSMKAFLVERGVRGVGGIGVGGIGDESIASWTAGS